MDWRAAWALVLAAGLMTAVGCNSATDSSSAARKSGGAATSDSTKPQKLSAEEALRRMIAAYQSAAAYRDEGVFRAVMARDGQEVPDAAPLSVAWERPNHIAVRAYQAAVTCDGRELQARIIDANSGNLDNQAVVRPAPERLALTDIFNDAVLRESLGGRLGLHPMQLELLLADNPLAAFLEEKATRRLLAPRTFDGHACLRVEVDLEGRYVFWIDQDQFLLRKFEYPADALLPEEEAGDVELSIAAEFTGARFDSAAVDTSDDRFTLAAFDLPIPDNARRVRFFVIPPQPLPTEMFGKRPEGYEFPALDGDAVTHQTLEGKIAVLAWFSNHPGSRACLESLDEVRRQLPSDAPAVFYGVCTEPSSLSNEEIQKVVESWGVTAPIVRDLGAFGRDAFDIRVAPSVVVLDAKGAVQIHESGANPQLAVLVKEQLAELVKRLAAGEDFAAAILTQAEAEREAYQANLRAAAEGVAANLQPAEIAPKTDPQHLQLTPAWTNTDLKQPGNILVVEEGDAAKLLVLDGWRTVVEIDEQGKTLRRTELDLPESAAVSYLRTVTDREGKRYYAACSLLAPQVHVFDAAWKRVFSYPSAEQEHEGIRDVAFANLDDQGGPLLAVGFWGVVGVQGVSLDGQRQWSNREQLPTLSLAVTPPDVAGWRKLLATGETGFVLRINQYGNADPAIQVPNRAIHQLVAADDGPADRPTVYLGFSYTPEGSLTAIGLSGEFQEMWSYRLPAGAHGNQLQFATPCRLFDAPGGHWLLAGPDGSVHLISDDGDFFDYYQTGQTLQGLAAARFADADTLLLATPAGLTATHLTRPAK